MNDAPSKWHSALGRLPVVEAGCWAIGGSVALALHGLPVVPRDLDLLADHISAEALIVGFGDAVMSDEHQWERGDVRAARRVMAVVEDMEVEILVGVETVIDGAIVLGTPLLDVVDSIAVGSRWFPVLSLSTMAVVLDSMGKRELALMVRDSQS